jgi:hypothetical protein
MALLLREAIDSGALPSMARLPMTLEEVTTAYDAAGASEDARRARRSPGDAVRALPDHVGLRECGWTDAMVREYLGEPNLTGLSP